MLLDNTALEAATRIVESLAKDMCYIHMSLSEHKIEFVAYDGNAHYLTRAAHSILAEPRITVNPADGSIKVELVINLAAEEIKTITDDKNEIPF